ncbi:MAG: FAD-dependent monooxygenase [Sphingobacteriales bacterium]|nr:MAG: FAD-dependent monooxygenase [Sphingobacteriales bacterium]
MPQQITLSLSPEQAADETAQKAAAAKMLGLPLLKIAEVRLLKRSVDARSRQTKVILKTEVYLTDEPLTPPEVFIASYPKVTNRYRAIIIGAGPAGLFAALRLLELGIRPIVLERGKDVRARRRDLSALNREHIVNPDSNYCFGEGGAGTYSDGKLYTRSDKRGNIRQILETFVAHGANPDILVDAHPHIGTNKLPQIITAIRESICNAGGEVHFNVKVTDFILSGNTIKGVIDQNNTRFESDAVLLATGHSARDIFKLLHRRNILIEAKPFALGVRIEHPQALIDQMQYKCSPQTGRGIYLPPAAYSWVEQVEGVGVYSFCMCPGGIIAPCATENGQIVTNGWSPSRRNNPYANSGIVTEIRFEDVLKYGKSANKTEQFSGVLGLMNFQGDAEHRAWLAGGQTQRAPAQRMIDFINRKLSTTLPVCSYQPGIVSAPLVEVLPPFVEQRLRAALRNFGKRAPLYLTNEAVLVGVESRTSSPVRIPRDSISLQHPQINGLFPCGEGAGYAGGIVSAAIDGIRCAEAIFKKVKQS